MCNCKEAIVLPLKENKRRITAIISQELEHKIVMLSENERRTKSSMAAILIEEAISQREKRKERSQS
jgi:hypothetical protein